MSKEEFVRGLTPKALIVSVATVVIFNILFPNDPFTFAWSQYPATRILSIWMPVVGLWVLMAIIIGLINFAKPVFSRQEVAMILIMIPWAVLVNSIFVHQAYARGTLALNPGILNTAAELNDPEFLKWLDVTPSIFGPKGDWVKNSAIWTTSYPFWSDFINWAPYMLYQTLWGGSICALGLFTSLLLRRIFITVEALPFPLADTQLLIADQTQPSQKRPKIFSNIYFWVGFLIQAVFIIPFTIHAMIPGMYLTTPPAYIWGIPFTALEGDLDFTKLALLPWVPLGLNAFPWILGWGYLMPMESAVGFVVGHVSIWVILPLVMNGMGLLPTFTAGMTYRGLQYTFNWRLAAAPNLIHSLATGFVLGLAGYTLFTHRSIVIENLRYIYQKPSPEKEAGEALPYRAIWAGWFLSVIALTATYALADVPVHWALISILMMVFLIVGIGKMVAETGGLLGGGTGALNYGLVVCITGFWGGVSLVAAGLATVSSKAATGMWYMTVFGNLGGTHALWDASINSPLTSLKVAEEVKLRKRDVVIGLLVVMLISALILPIIPIYRIYLFDKQVPLGTDIEHYLTEDGGPAIKWYWGYGDAITNPALWPKQFGPLALCFILVFVIYFLRGRFSWFTINPAGIALATMIGSSVWFMFLMGFILKWLTIKVGGVELYESKGKHIAVGLIAGQMVLLFIAAIFNSLIVWRVQPWYRPV